MAVHSDTWLIAVAFYNGARLNKEGRCVPPLRHRSTHVMSSTRGPGTDGNLHPRCRERLFSLINELPTCYEVVSGKAAAAAPANKGKKRAAAGGAGAPRKQYKQVRA